MIKKLSSLKLPFMIIYSSLYLLCIFIAFYFFVLEDFFVGQAKSRLDNFTKNPFLNLYFFIGFILTVSYPLTVIVSLFSISKKLTKIEKIIKKNQKS